MLKAANLLTRWLSWLEHHPIHQKAVGSIPSQGTYLVCRFHPWSGCICEAANQCFSLASLSFSLPPSPFLSVKSINTSSDEIFFLILKLQTKRIIFLQLLNNWRQEALSTAPSVSASVHTHTHTHTHFGGFLDTKTGLKLQLILRHSGSF